jgi:hypothetical protein
VDERSMKPALRIVSDTGEILDQHPDVQRLEDEIRGLTRALKREIRLHEELKRDKDAEARAHQLWPKAMAIFAAWKIATGHSRSDWTPDRFWQIEPWLRNRKYGVEVCVRAVSGIAFDPFVSRRRNGTVERHDSWELCFRDTCHVEKYASKCPKGWRELPYFADVLERFK